MKNKKILKNVLFIVLVLSPMLFFGQDINDQINTWKVNVKIIAQSLIGLAAIGGGVYTYFKMQTSDGGGGNKAVLTFVGALLFGALLFGVIEFFLG